MRSIIPRPVLLALTLMLVIGAIAALELRLDAQASANKEPKSDLHRDEIAQGGTDVSDEHKQQTASDALDDAERSGSQGRDAGEKPEQTVSEAERIANKENEYERASEIIGSTGLINTDGVSIKDAAGEKVVLVEFWTYSCFNCQNAQPHINALYEKYQDDGLLVVGVHSPEFGFERDISNVRDAVGQANIEYPVVLDNNYAIWNAYGQRFWPAWYLIDADGFVRYKHFGEGAYEETDQKVQELLAERDRLSDRL